MRYERKSGGSREREIGKIREEAILTKKANDSSVRGRESE